MAGPELKQTNSNLNDQQPGTRRTGTMEEKVGHMVITDIETIQDTEMIQDTGMT